MVHRRLVKSSKKRLGDSDLHSQKKKKTFKSLNDLDYLSYKTETRRIFSVANEDSFGPL